MPSKMRFYVLKRRDAANISINFVGHSDPIVNGKELNAVNAFIKREDAEIYLHTVWPEHHNLFVIVPADVDVKYAGDSRKL